MNWKSLIVLLILLSLVGYMFLSEERGHEILYLLRSKVGRFLGTLKQGRMGAFPLSLESQGNIMLGQRVRLSDSTLKGVMSLGLIEINGNRISIKENKYEVAMNGFYGNVEVSDDGVVIMKGKASYVVIGDFSFLGDERSVSVILQGVPFRLDMTKVHQDFSFVSVKGKLRVEDKLELRLSNDNLNVIGFSGTVSLKEDGVSLEGMASGLELKGEGIRVNVS